MNKKFKKLKNALAFTQSCILNIQFKKKILTNRQKHYLFLPCLKPCIKKPGFKLFYIVELFKASISKLNNLNKYFAYMSVCIQ